MSAPLNPRRPEPSGLNHTERVARREMRVISYVTTAYKYSANGNLLSVARMGPQGRTGPDTDHKPY